MPSAYINIGSNRGDRMALISRAVALIAESFPDITVSDTVESEPWGFESSSPFLNVGARFSCHLPPEELLEKLLEIEKSISPLSHRNADGSYRDRLIDIDLIAVDDIVVETPRLTLPHPRMHLRPFVLIPMAELAPGWVHPKLHLTARQLLDRLNG